MAPNNSEIKCKVCKGTKISPWGSKHECGACLGSGRSTVPWDQPRNGTTVGLRWEDFQRIGVQERTIGYTIEEMRQALIARQSVSGLTERSKTFPDLQIHMPGTVTRDHKGRQRLTGILISWQNMEYVSRLELDRQDLLSGMPA